jgi:hypothetical protein
VQYRKAQDYSIYTSTEWSCRKDEKEADGKGKVHAQWFHVREIILGRGSGTACYLVNISLSSTLDDKTPQQVWSGKKPSLTHIKVFGCEAYVHVPKEKKVS